MYVQCQIAQLCIQKSNPGNLDRDPIFANELMKVENTACVLDQSPKDGLGLAIIQYLLRASNCVG